MNLVKVKENIFREYDIRGIYNTEINEDVAYTIGRSFSSYIDSEKVIVGYDNRLSSNSLFEALTKGLTESGSDVINLGLVTTPMYYFAKKKLNLKYGIMITASHNPKEYNGFKISFDYGKNACGKEISDFCKFTNNLSFKTKSGNISTYNIHDEYLENIRNSISLGEKKIKVAVDLGSGTGCIIIRDILNMFNIDYELLFGESDGNFPYHEADPSVPKNQRFLSEKVRSGNFDFGFGIDGDADRVGIVDNNGKILSTEYFMILMYKDLLNKTCDKRAIYDVKCSRMLKDELDKMGYTSFMYRTGASYMGRKINEDKYIFGAEYSGHTWFNDNYLGFDDGIYAGLRMVELLSKTNSTLSYLCKDFSKYYSSDEIKIKTTDDSKFKIIEKIKEYVENKNYKYESIDGVRVEFDDGWALLRASNTEPKLTLRFEAKTEERLEEIKGEFLNLVNETINM